MNSEIYFPAEDSYLMSEILRKKVPEILEKNPKTKVLEMGSGSGIQLVTLRDLGIKNITGTDINPAAVRKCKSLGFRCVLSNLFSKISGKYDIIIFNPPYLPTDNREPKSSRAATTGGKKGSEIINKFLRLAKSHLRKNGKIFLLTSSLTEKVYFSGYEKTVISRKKIFFEELIIFELRLENKV